MSRPLTALTLALMMTFGAFTAAQAAPTDEVVKPTYTAADAELLARLLWSECRGESREGQLMVAQCVLDRLADGRWGDTLESVINYGRGNDKPQFAPLGELDDALLEVAEAALGGGRFDPDAQILFFRVSNNKTWYAPWLGKVGKHSYYGEVLSDE